MGRSSTRPPEVENTSRKSAEAPARAAPLPNPLRTANRGTADRVSATPAPKLNYSPLVIRRAPGTTGRRSKLYPELNLGEMARKAGVDAAYLSRIMRGLQQPSLAAALRIANAFGVPVGEIARLHRKP